MLNNVIKTCLIVLLLLLASCESPTSQTQEYEIKSDLPVINIGRLICGGYFDMRFAEQAEQLVRGK